SILIGSLLLIGIDNSVQAAETNSQMSEIERQNDKDNIEGIKSSGATGGAQSHILVNEKNDLKNDEQTSSEHSLHNDKTNVELEDVGEGTLNKEAPEYNENDRNKTKASNEVDPEYKEKDRKKTKTTNETDPEYNENDKNKTEASDEVDLEYNESDKTKTEPSNEVGPENNKNDKNKTEASDEVDPEYNESDK